MKVKIKAFPLINKKVNKILDSITLVIDAIV